MNGLLDFITFTKGTEYLLAIAFLFTFLVFWQVAHHRGKGLALRTAPLAVVALGLAGLVSTCVGTPAVANSPSEEALTVSAAHYTANIYGPAKFAAHEMGPEVVSCQTCHHHSPDGQPKACKECHSEPFDGQNMNKPGLKAAYHQRCAECHTAAFSGPLTCSECHTDSRQQAHVSKATLSQVAPPGISHSLLDRYGNCLVCHNPEGSLPLPGNHSRYSANVVCLGCHKAS